LKKLPGQVEYLTRKNVELGDSIKEMKAELLKEMKAELRDSFNEMKAALLKMS
jgi:hypothetical protein